MNIAENLLIKYQMLLNSFCLSVEFFFEMVTKNVEELPRNWKGWIFSFLSFFFYTPTIDTAPLQSLVAQQNVPRTDEIHRHFFIFFINGGLDSKKGFISCVGGVGQGKCKGKLNTFKYINNIVNLPLLLLAVAWAKAGKSVKKILADFLFCGGVLLLQKFTHLIIILEVFVSSFHSVVHPEGCVLLQWQDEGMDKKYDGIFSSLQLLDTEGLAFVFWRVFLILCGWICPLLLHTIIY